MVLGRPGGTLLLNILLQTLSGCVLVACLLRASLFIACDGLMVSESASLASHIPIL